MISKSRSRITTAEQELAEIRRRESNDRAFKHQVDGLPYSAQIREAHRYDWTRRYTAAMSADEQSEQALEVRLDKSLPRLFLEATLTPAQHVPLAFVLESMGTVGR